MEIRKWLLRVGGKEMFKGQIGTEVLRTPEGIVRVLKDTVTGTYSIGLVTNEDYVWKYISEELYELLVKELSEQEGNSEF